MSNAMPSQVEFCASFSWNNLLSTSMLSMYCFGFGPALRVLCKLAKCILSKLMWFKLSTGLQGHLSLLYNLQLKMISTFQNPYGTGMSMVDKLHFKS
jgi:hypothetical protein